MTLPLPRCPQGPFLHLGPEHDIILSFMLRERHHTGVVCVCVCVCVRPSGCEKRAALSPLMDVTAVHSFLPAGSSSRGEDASIMLMDGKAWWTMPVVTTMQLI